MDIAAALNAELWEVQAAGCDVIQIDEPAMTASTRRSPPTEPRALDRCWRA